MVHYRMREPDPSAIVLAQNPRTGSYEEAKMYSGYNQKEVYLQDKQNFALRFFNPLQVKIGARISFNGILSDDYLVLNPGEDVLLERFLGEQKKMVFETYTIDASNPAAVKATEKNGLVEISFYKEKIKQYFSTWHSGTGGWGGFYGACGTPGSGGGTRNSGSFCTTDSADYIGSASTDFGSRKLSKSFEEEEECFYDAPVETGRVESGDYSSQNLLYTNVEFEIFPFFTYVIKLIPQSGKNYTYASTTSTNTYTTRDVRNYCTKCGYRLRNDNWLYCPKCGEKL